MNTAAEAILAVLDERAPGTTICPGEAARRLAGPDGNWCGKTEAVHAAGDTLSQQGAVTLSWQGMTMQKRRGPCRIARR